MVVVKTYLIMLILLIISFFMLGCKTTGYSILKPSCPYACCVEDLDYNVKVCADSSANCVNNQCVKCGNGLVESGENCRTCPADVQCKQNQACSDQGECIGLGTDINCRFINDRCEYYESCINFERVKKACPYECCDGSTYALKSCKSSFDKCDMEQKRCINKITDSVGSIAGGVKDSADKAIAGITNNLDDVVKFIPFLN